MNISALCPRAFLSKTSIHKKKNLKQETASITKIKKLLKQSQQPYFSEVQPGLINKLRSNKAIRVK